jgi:folylpolyglutamate synthase/dihydropteroate synthase
MSNLEDLRKEADDLGISYTKTLGETKLQEKINAFYEEQETGGPALEATAEEKEATKEKAKAAALTKRQRSALKRVEREKTARATRIVTIIDNDQRVNNQTTTCTVNCSNEFFDLGTVVLPLNERIEVAMGHIRTLRQVQIPLHMRDNKTGLSSVRLRPRYTVTFS